MLDQEKVKQIEEYYAQCEREGANEHQIEESQKAVANMESLLVTLTDRAVAEDFIKHMKIVAEVPRLQVRQCSYSNRTYMTYTRLLKN